MGGEIKWEPDLETGIKIIDRQHKEFFKLVNALLNNSMGSKNKDFVLKAFNFLNFYIIEHFGMEESLMTENKYTSLREHMGLHRYFRIELEKLEAQLKGNHFDEVTIRLNYLMVNWFVNHIKVQDKKLAKFLQEEMKINKSLSGRIASLMKKFFGK
ncbi:MAG: hypothetical protein A2X45_14985 [Lentisphaerae bacterium GWF2_50_93]|nr:MAG: hypothetical protein A2X45_14985 [Lentisphaerae bacterium GWF2_50_93]